VKNHRLGFEIPYCFGGVWHAYVPDFIVELWEPQHVDNPLCLVVEVKGRRTEQDRAKASRTRKFRLPAVNRHGGFGRWSFVELTDVDTMTSDYDEAVSRLGVPWSADTRERPLRAPPGGMGLTGDRRLDKFREIDPFSFRLPNLTPVPRLKSPFQQESEKAPLDTRRNAGRS